MFCSASTGGAGAQEAGGGILMALSGVVIATKGRWAAQLAALDAHRPGVARVHLYGNVDVAESWGPAFGAAELDDVRARLAPGGRLIVRTAEGLVAAAEMERQLSWLLPGSGESVARYLMRTQSIL